MGVVRSKIFIDITTAPGTGVVPAGKLWLVKYAWISNQTGASRTYSVQITHAGVVHTAFSGTLLNGNTFSLPIPFTIGAGDTLQLSGAVTALIVHASGIEFTP